jgi:hypothetical protein
MSHANVLTVINRCIVVSLMCSLVACRGDRVTVADVVTELRFILQPGTTGAGVPVTMTVELVSDAGERATSATNRVTLSAAGAPLGGTTTVAAVAGLATFTGVTFGSIGQNIQLTARAGDLTTMSHTFKVVAGPANASQSTMTVSPLNAVANANVTLTLVIKDALGNAVVGAAASFSANVAGVTFTPPSGTTDANGSVTTVFRSQGSGPVSISVNVAGTHITMPTLITVAAGPSALRFFVQPPTVSVGQSFAASAEILDNNGQRMTSAVNPVALALDAGILQGTTTVNAIAGLASFNNLSVPAAASGLVLTATSGTLTVQSNPFNVVANPCVPGTMTLGIPVVATVVAGSGCTLNNHPAASFRFAVTSPTATVVTLGGASAGGFAPALAFTTEPAGADVSVFVPSAQTPTREWLLASGTYLASVSSTTGTAGNFTINTSNVGTGPAGCVLRSLVSVNVTYIGQSLASTDCRDPNPAGVWYEDRYLVFDSRPCVITLSAVFDAYMELRETSLAVVADDDDSGPGTDAQIARATCRSGPNPYVIAASSFDEAVSGPYTLTITFTSAAPGVADETITIRRPSASTLRPTTLREVFRGRIKR